MPNTPSRPAPPHPPDDRADWEAVARYLAGESADGEAAAVRQWLADHPDDAAFAVALEGAFPPVATTTPVDVEGALARVKAARDAADVHSIDEVPGAAMRRLATLRAGTADAGRPGPAAARWGSRRSLVALAAAAAVFLATLFVWRSRPPAAGGGTVASAQVFVTGVGERDSVVLSDGSRVVLGPSSRLTMAVGYGQARRDVELQGEGYFDVRHDAARPFAVHAGGADIRDVGTTFAVHSDTTVGVRVVVTAGAVHIQAAHGAANLGAGDVASLRADGEIIATRGGATDDDLAWTRGRLVFREASMAEVRADVRRWYGIDLRITDDSLARRHLTASFGTEGVEGVLRVIGMTLGASVTRRGDTAFVGPMVPPRGR